MIWLVGKGLESIVQVGDIMYSREEMIRCPLDNTFSLIGKRFTVHILRNMMSNQTRFNQFIETIDGINPKTLSTRLKEMEKNGLIQRKIYHETPVRIEYNLTQKGKNLKPILDEMALFSARFCVKDVFRNGKPRTYKEISSIIS